MVLCSLVRRRAHRPLQRWRQRRSRDHFQVEPGIISTLFKESLLKASSTNASKVLRKRKEQAALSAYALCGKPTYTSAKRAFLGHHFGQINPPRKSHAAPYCLHNKMGGFGVNTHHDSILLLWTFSSLISSFAYSPLLELFHVLVQCVPPAKTVPSCLLHFLHDPAQVLTLLISPSWPTA